MKEKILKYFKDVNGYYNDCMRYEELSRMLDELIEETKSSLLDNISAEIKERQNKLGHSTLAECGRFELKNALKIIEKYKEVSK